MIPEEGIKPCPFCGSKAIHETIEDGDDKGGEFIQCTNAMCGASTNLRFSCGEDAKSLLIEQWNRRVDEKKQIAKKLTGNETIVGSMFTWKMKNDNAG